MSAPKALKLRELIGLAESGNSRAAHTLIREFGEGDQSPELVAYMRRCCLSISRGETPGRALHISRGGGRESATRRREIEQHLMICEAILRKIDHSPGRGKVQRAQAAVQEDLGLTPRAVRTAWDDKTARCAAKASCDFVQDVLTVEKQQWPSRRK
jgi:hypothetical protein